MAPHPRGNVIRVGAVAVTDHFKRVPVVVGQQRLDEERRGVLPQISRDVSDANAPGLSCRGMHECPLGRRRVGAGPSAVFLEPLDIATSGVVLQAEDEIAVSRGAPGAKINRATKCCQRLGNETHFQQGSARIIECRGKIAAQCDGALEAAQRPSQLALRAENLTKIIEKIGNSGIQRNRTRHQANGSGSIPTLMRDQPEEMICGRMIRIACENCAVRRFGFGQSTVSVAVSGSANLILNVLSKPDSSGLVLTHQRCSIPLFAFASSLLAQSR